MSVWILPILGRMVIYRLIGMNRLCVVLIVSVFALNAAAQETVKLTSVGLSVDVDSSWELTQDVTTESGGQVGDWAISCVLTQRDWTCFSFCGEIV